MLFSLVTSFAAGAVLALFARAWLLVLISAVVFWLWLAVLMAQGDHWAAAMFKAYAAVGCLQFGYIFAALFKARS